MSPSLFNTLNLIKVFGAALVVASHYAGQYYSTPFYSYGTGCFFVVSGYYAFNWERHRGWYYLAKRLTRLYPAFLVALLAYLLARQIPLAEWPLLTAHHLTFLLSTPDRATVFALNPPFWSLAVFFTFFALVAFLPRITPRFWQVVVLMLLAAGALWLNVTTWREGYIELWVAPLHLYAFWLGGWLGARAHRRPVPLHWGYTWLAVGIMLLIVVCGAYYQWLTRVLFLGETFAYRGAMVVLYALLFWAMIHSPLAARGTGLLSFLGTISFGVYLFHNLPIYWMSDALPASVAVVLSVGLSVGVAWLSWRFVESPFQRWSKPRLAKWHRQPAAALPRDGKRE